MASVWVVILWIVWGSPQPNIPVLEPTFVIVGLAPPVLIPGVTQAPTLPVAARPAPPAVDTLAADFDRLAQCESSGNWADNTGNGFYGGLQWEIRTWRGAVTRAGYPEWANRLPSAAPASIQIAAGIQLHSERGFQPWPACSRSLGLVGK